MQTRTGLTAMASSPRSRLEVQDHSVFQALPADAQARIEAGGRRASLAAGEVLPNDGGLYFIHSGVVGLFPGGGRICVAAVTAGSVHGWDQALEPGAPSPGGASPDRHRRLPCRRRSPRRSHGPGMADPSRGASCDGPS